jgi:cytochrome b561
MVRNTKSTWGWPAKLLHWFAAILILLLLGHGWWMTHFAPRPDRLAHYAGHAALGYDLLALTVLRLLWRWINPVPTLPLEMPRWEAIAAHISHWSLYVLMLAASITGWALAGTLRTPLDKDVFNIRIPMIASPGNRALHEFLENSHAWLAYLLAALLLVHVAAALRHHFTWKDNVLRRMTWGSADAVR